MNKIKSILISFVTIFVALTPVAGAQEANGEGGSGGLSISPTRFEFVIDRGKAELVSIQVENITNGPMIAQAFLNDFEPDGNSGNPKLIVDAEERSSSSIRDFVVELQDVRIEAGETAVVNVPVQVPDNAAPGAYYGAIRFKATPAEENQNKNENAQLSLNASVAAIVLIEVPGDITEQIKINRIGAYLNRSIGNLFTKKPSQLGAEIENLGNGFSKPFGTIILSGPWGKGELYSYEINDTIPKGNVLPGSSRLFLEDIPDGTITLPGRYTIDANISHGSGGEIFNIRSSFWYLPTWFIIIIVVILLILTGIVYYLYRKYRSKNFNRRR